MWQHVQFLRLRSGLAKAAAIGSLALALAGCNDIAAQRAAPIRPVLVTAVHYEAQARDRSFVGTIRRASKATLDFASAARS